jgi:hypothetical protein
MNNTKLADAVKSGLTEARDSLSTVHLAIPASEIMARTDQARRHRRLGVLAGAGGLAAMAVAVSVTLPASHPASSHPAAGPGARLAAWTVTRQAHGTIRVRFFGEFRDPAALQHTLRADGVPASVTYLGQQNPACQSIPAGGPAPGSRGRPRGPGQRGGSLISRVMYGTGTTIFIDPSALPSGDGVQIAVMRGMPSGPAGPWPYPKGSPHAGAEFGLVKASRQCTGS